MTTTNVACLPRVAISTLGPNRLYFCLTLSVIFTSVQLLGLLWHVHWGEKEDHWLHNITQVETRQKPLSVTTLSTKGNQKIKGSKHALKHWGNDLVTHSGLWLKYNIYCASFPQRQQYIHLYYYASVSTAELYHRLNFRT